MPEQQFYDQIAARFAFELPTEYRQMQERGWMTLDRPSTSISTKPDDGYLWMADMEWYSLQEIATFEFPDFYHPHLPHLVPFAFSGGGDYWCWQTNHTDERGTRVLLCLHDTCSAIVHAPNIAGALYRQALRYACSWVEGQPDDFAEGRTYLHRWAVDLAVALPSSWCEVLAALVTRPAVVWSGSGPHRRFEHRSLMSLEEMKQIEARDLHFPGLDTEFPWADLPAA